MPIVDCWMLIDLSISIQKRAITITIVKEMERISSRQNALVRQFRDVAQGDVDDALLLDGDHLIQEALASDIAIDVAAFSERLAAGRLASALTGCRNAGRARLRRRAGRDESRAVAVRGCRDRAKADGQPRTYAREGPTTRPDAARRAGSGQRRRGGASRRRMRRHRSRVQRADGGSVRLEGTARRDGKHVQAAARRASIAACGYRRGTKRRNTNLCHGRTWRYTADGMRSARTRPPSSLAARERDCRLISPRPPTRA